MHLGQEIASFFNRYGEVGACGIVIASLLFACIVFYVLNIIDKKEINTYNELINDNKLIKFFEQAFLLVCFCIMIAGIGAFFEEQFGIAHCIGALVGGLVCFLVFLYKYKGLEVFNLVLVPFIIIGILLVGVGKYDLNALDNIKYTMHNSFTNSFFISSMLYVGYNSLVLIPITVNLKRYSLTNKQKACVAIGSFAILCLVGLAVYRAINLFFPQIMVFELPTLKLAKMLGDIQGYLYGIIILFAIFTTAVSCGFAFLEIDEKNYMMKNILLCIAGFVLSNIGFSELVNTLFPIFGYVGILFIVIIIYCAHSRNKKE